MNSSELASALASAMVREMEQDALHEMAEQEEEEEEAQIITETVIDRQKGEIYTREYQVAEYLGKGGYGAVYEVHQLDSGDVHAMKIIEKKRLKHPIEKRRVGPFCS